MSRPTTDPPRPSRDLIVSLACLAAVVAGSIGSLLLRREVPVTLLANSGYDDALFIRQAAHLSSGHWLGPFDDLTLSKGPAYPAFIAVMHVLNIPLKVGEQLTLLLAAGCLAACVWVVTRRTIVATVVYLAVAVDPASFGFAASRVLRDSWYASLTLLVVASFFLAVHGAVTRTRLVWVLPTSVLAGVSAAAFWLCREEGPVILPAIAAIALGLPVWAVVRGRSARTAGPVRRKRSLVKGARLAGVFALTGIAAAVPVGYVAVQNDRHYGAALTNDVSAGEYARAYADWADVRAGTPIAHVPISAAQRAAVYAISPAASELETELEAPDNHWRQPSCRIAKVCDDFAGGWEVWALREAASDAGHFSSETAVQSYFGQVADDIEAACSSARLTCDRHLPPSLEPFQHATVPGVRTAAWRGVVFLGSSTVLTTVPGPQVAVSPGQRKSFAAMITNLPTSPRSAQVREQKLAGRATVYHVLTGFYLWLLPLLLVTTAAGIILSLLRRKRIAGPMAVLLAALAIGALSRLLLLAVIDSTTFPAVASVYELATRALLLGFALAGTALLADNLIDLRTGIRAGRADVSRTG